MGNVCCPPSKQRLLGDAEDRLCHAAAVGNVQLLDTTVWDIYGRSVGFVGKPEPGQLFRCLWFHVWAAIIRHAAVSGQTHVLRWLVKEVFMLEPQVVIDLAMESGKIWRMESTVAWCARNGYVCHAADLRLEAIQRRVETSQVTMLRKKQELQWLDEIRTL